MLLNANLIAPESIYTCAMFEATADEMELTGAIGILLYVTILVLASFALFRGVKSVQTMYFFYAMLIMAIFELPRYVALNSDKQYTCVLCYACHIFGSLFFFIAFSIVAYQWSGVLAINLQPSYFKEMYSL